jgi:hypothetical protein
MGVARIGARGLVFLAATLAVPAAIVWWFAAQGALWVMEYCVIGHQLIPGLKQWSYAPWVHWVFPVSVPLLAVYAWAICGQSGDSRLAVRRAIAGLAPLLYIALLVSYWPEVTREDALPYIPLMPFALAPLVLPLTTGGLARFKPLFWKFAAPLLVIAEIVGILHAEHLKQHRLEVTSHSIADVLLLTKPGDYVMDEKGDYIFRRRPSWWVYEPVTVVRVRAGLINNELPQQLAATSTKLCYLYSGRRAWAEVTAFITRNYLPFDPHAQDLGAAGKEIGNAPDEATFNFFVRIPQRYAVVSETGATEGLLDGLPYHEPVELAPGPHRFKRTAGGGRAAIILAAVVENGFKPLFDVSERVKTRAMTPDWKHPDLVPMPE